MFALSVKDKIGLSKIWKSENLPGRKASGKKNNFGAFESLISLDDSFNKVVFSKFEDSCSPSEVHFSFIPILGWTTTTSITSFGSVQLISLRKVLET